MIEFQSMAITRGPDPLRTRPASSCILRTGVLEAFLFPRDTGNRISLPARMFSQSVLERKEAHHGLA